MERQKVLKRITSFSLVIVMTLAFMPVFGLSDANAASSKGRLVKTFTIQSYDKSKKKYVKTAKYTFKYNKKGDPVKIVKTFYYSDGSSFEGFTETSAYKYKKSVRKSRKTTLNNGEGGIWNYSVKYDKKGNPIQASSSFEYDTTTTKYKDTFTRNKKGYLTKWVSTYTDSDNPGIENKFTSKYKVKMKNGLLKKNARRSYDNDLKKYTLDFTATYNKKGFISKMVEGSAQGTTKYKYTIKKGRVTTVEESFKDDDGYSWKNRYKITYTKKKAGKVRYARMINDLLAGHGIYEGGYSMYAWY